MTWDPWTSRALLEEMTRIARKRALEAQRVAARKAHEAWELRSGKWRGFIDPAQFGVDLRAPQPSKRRRKA